VLGTSTKHQDGPCVDFVVTMPLSIFQEKDFLNYRYFMKRAYYLSCIAAAIKLETNEVYDIRFAYLNGNHLLPILTVQPPAKAGTTADWKIQVIPTIARGVFNERRLLPSKNCVRENTSDSEAEKQDRKATAFYNASIISDSLATSYLKLQHDMTQSCHSFLDACILGRTWLRQRGFSSHIENGGVGNFEWSIITALLLKGGGPKNTPLFSHGYSSYQLFKAVLQVLATRDLAKDPAIINGDSVIHIPRGNGIPYFLDGERNHNILFKMTPWSYKLLQQDAHNTLEALSDPSFDPFETTFILKADQYLCRYDAVVEIPHAQLLSLTGNEQSSHQSKYQNLYKVLMKALNTRAKLIAIHMDEQKPWAIDQGNPKISDEQMIVVGFILDPASINRTVDRGPTAHNTKESASYRKFWGEKAELRRFRDGSIVDCVIWTPDGSTVFKTIVSFVLSKHFSPELLQSTRFVEDLAKRYLPVKDKRQKSDQETFQSAISALQDLQQNIRDFDDMPLHLRQILPADSQLSYSSIHVLPRTGSTRLQPPANVTIQFEGSGKWPNDMDAIQRTKVAFLLKLAELLEQSINNITCRTGLENEGYPLANQTFLDVINSNGHSFRLRIHHEREASLLEQMLRGKSHTPQSKIEAAGALHIYKQMFIHRPIHTMAIQTLATRNPSYSSTIRLAKTWFSRHLLSPHFHEVLIELFVARVYTEPYPWSVPTNAVSGLLRTLLLLSRWDWRNEPWIANLGSESMSEAEVTACHTRFQAWRKIDPNLNRLVLFAASNVDSDGASWTDHAKPPKVVANRMTALARSAVQMMKLQGTRLELDSIFSSNLSDYDFTLYVDCDVADGIAGKRDTTKFKNLQLQQEAALELVGYDPIQDFVSELEARFGDAMVLFFDMEKRSIISGLWNPQTRRPWKLKLGYSSAPVGQTGEVDVNRDAVLNEIARLGGSLIKNIIIKGESN
jgi:U3 small nucleolar RNA-associated protein 22